MKKQLLLFVLTLLPFVANADQSGTCGDNLTWTYEEATQTLTISGTGDMTSGLWTYSFGSKVNKIIIEEGVTSICNRAFSGFTSLLSVTIPESITSIGNNAFDGCTSISSITIPKSITSIGDDAFNKCTCLTSVTINCPVVGSWFRNDWNQGLNIKEIVLGEDVTTINDYAFREQRSLTSITFPESLTSIGRYAFGGCDGLTSLSFPNSVTDIGEDAFSDCSGLTSLTLPNNLSVIEKYAFSGCSGLVSLIIPNSVTTIKGYAFSGCKNLGSITIGTGVTEIEQYAFKNVGNAKTIWLTNTPPSGYYHASGTINYVSNDRYPTSENYKVYKVYTFLGSIFEVDGIKYVPISPSERTCAAIDCVYDNSAEHTRITSSVTYSGITLNLKEVMPYVCYKNLYIKDAVLDYEGIIPDCAFYGCDAMKEVEYSDKITYIGKSAFSGCPTLTMLGTKEFIEKSYAPSMEITEAIYHVDDYAFNGCTAIKNVILDNKDNVEGMPVTKRFSDIFDEKESRTLSFLAFAGDTLRFDWNWKNPESVTLLGSNHFKVAVNGKTVFASAHKNDTNGTFEIVFEEAGVMNVGISISSGLVFSITDITLQSRLGSLYLGSNDDKALFDSCPLDSVYIGCDIVYSTERNKGYSPFCNNMTLRSVAITDKETEISENEFSGCSGMKFLSFGAGIESIGKEAFSDCAGVTSIISRATTPPACGDQALDDISKWTCRVQVPEGSLSQYQQADQWKEFFFIEEVDPQTVEDGPMEKCATPTISYESGKLVFACTTADAKVLSKVKVDDSRNSDENIDLSQKYVITAYALAPGHERSDVATATITWRNGSPVMEGFDHVKLQDGETSCDVNGDGTVDVADIATIISEMAAQTRGSREETTE